MKYALECAALVKRFGDFTAVDGVSLQIPRGSFFSILGPSGCGKTTLLRMFAGFETPDTGDIFINGESVLAAPPNKRNVKMVFQHLALFPMMNVIGNVVYGLRANGVDRKEAARLAQEALARVGLPDSANKEIEQLSGGQKQRVAIARCMALKPEALLLDEPLGALDLKLREQMKIELKTLQRQFDTTFIYITHDQSEALVMSDQIAVMNRGQFEQIGSPRELYHTPKTAFVAAFVGDNNRWRGVVTDDAGELLTVKTESGMRVKCVNATKTPPPHALLDVFIRPEAIAVADDAHPPEGGNSSDIADAVNAQSGAVEDVLFNGANSRILVRADDGGIIEAALPQTGPFAKLQREQRITLRWRAADCVWFPASDSAIAPNRGNEGAA